MKITKLVIVSLNSIFLTLSVQATLGDIVRVPGAVAADIVEGTTDVAGSAVDVVTGQPPRRYPRRDHYYVRELKPVEAEETIISTGKPGDIEYVGTEYYID